MIKENPNFSREFIPGKPHAEWNNAENSFLLDMGICERGVIAVGWIDTAPKSRAGYVGITESGRLRNYAFPIKNQNGETEDGITLHTLTSFQVRAGLNALLANGYMNIDLGLYLMPPYAFLRTEEIVPEEKKYQRDYTETGIRATHFELLDTIKTGTRASRRLMNALWTYGQRPTERVKKVSREASSWNEVLQILKTGESLKRESTLFPLEAPR